MKHRLALTKGVMFSCLTWGAEFTLAAYSPKTEQASLRSLGRQKAELDLT